MIHLVTGYAGYEHIQSADEGAYNAAFFGNGQYVMESGNQFEASIIDNNTVRILDGDGMMYGRHFRIPRNTYEDVTIQTGSAGKNRIDLICMAYAKNDDGTETAYIQVIKGSETTGTAKVPTYTNGNILEGAVLNQMPLYKVVIEGINLTEVVPMFATIPTYKTLAEKYAAQFEATIKALKAADILDSMEEVEANTQSNMFAGALALKEAFAELDGLTGYKSIFSGNLDDLHGTAYCGGYLINSSSVITGDRPFANSFHLWIPKECNGTVQFAKEYYATSSRIKARTWHPTQKVWYPWTDDYEKAISVAANKVLVSDASGKLSASDITTTELGYLAGMNVNVKQYIDEVGQVAATSDYKLKYFLPTLQTKEGILGKYISGEINVIKNADGKQMGTAVNANESYIIFCQHRDLSDGGASIWSVILSESTASVDLLAKSGDVYPVIGLTTGNYVYLKSSNVELTTSVTMDVAVLRIR